MYFKNITESCIIWLLLLLMQKHIKNMKVYQKKTQNYLKDTKLQQQDVTPPIERWKTTTKTQKINTKRQKITTNADTQT